MGSGGKVGKIMESKSIFLEEQVVWEFSKFCKFYPKSITRLGREGGSHGGAEGRDHSRRGIFDGRTGENEAKFLLEEIALD
jgi:hypothetical protein